MIEFLEKYPKTTIFATVFLMLIVHLGVLDITIMEARNFITAREMVLDGNWLLTTMNGEARYQKPPLPTWLSALSALVFGVKSLFAMRLPAALMVALLGIYSYKFSIELLKDKAHSLINALLTVTSFYVFAIVNEAPWDIYAHGFMLIAIYHLFKFFTSEIICWKQILGAGFFTGLSIMSKGPVSLFALFLPFLIAFGMVFKYKGLLKKTFALLAYLAISLIIGTSWFFYVRYADADTFLAIASKESNNWSSYNVKPFYYYWSFFIQSGLWTIPAFISLLYPYLKNRVSHPKLYKFIWLWTFIAVILLSVIPEKKSRYLMPVLIPLALNTGFYIQYLISHFKNLKDKKETFPVYFNFGLLALVALIVPEIIFIALKRFPANWLSYGLLAIATVIIGFKLFTYLRSKDIKTAFYLLIAFMVSLFLFGLPLAKEFRNPRYKSVHQLKSNLEPIYAFNDLTPEMLWKYGKKIKTIKADDSSLPKENKFGILIMKEDVDTVKELFPRYTFKYITTYNHNPGKKKRKRLFRDYYVLTKKN